MISDYLAGKGIEENYGLDIMRGASIDE